MKQVIANKSSCSKLMLKDNQGEVYAAKTTLVHKSTRKTEFIDPGILKKFRYNALNKAADSNHPWLKKKPGISGLFNQANKQAALI